MLLLRVYVRSLFLLFEAVCTVSKFKKDGRLWRRRAFHVRVLFRLDAEGNVLLHCCARFIIYVSFQ